MQLETRESWEKHSQHCWGDIRTKLSLWLREKKRKQSKYKEQMITQFCSIRLLIPRQMIRCDLEGPGLISSNKLSVIFCMVKELKMRRCIVILYVQERRQAGCTGVCARTHTCCSGMAAGLDA